MLNLNFMPKIDSASLKNSAESKNHAVYGPLWPSMTLYGPLGPSTTLYDPLQLSIALHGPKW